MTSLKQVFTMTMDVHARFRTEAHQVRDRGRERCIAGIVDTTQGMCHASLCTHAMLPSCFTSSLHPHALRTGCPSRPAAVTRSLSVQCRGRRWTRHPPLHTNRGTLPVACVECSAARDVDNSMGDECTRGGMSHPLVWSTAVSNHERASFYGAHVVRCASHPEAHKSEQRRGVDAWMCMHMCMFQMGYASRALELLSSY